MRGAFFIGLFKSYSFLQLASRTLFLNVLLMPPPRSIHFMRVRQTPVHLHAHGASQFCLPTVCHIVSRLPKTLAPQGRSRGGSVRLASGVPSPERGDRNWDTRLLGCEVSQIGVIAADVHATILQGLSQKGFKAVKTLPAITSQTTASTAGIYTRNGVRYSVKLIQVLAKNPKNRGGGGYLYIRGNSYTTISLQSLSEPIGYTLP
ncbi:hypothetical protein GQR58_000273 [Nymphon striatum]|nr:hypothetical protein GQR58_000273 [Nymphon striatum]